MDKTVELTLWGGPKDGMRVTTASSYRPPQVFRSESGVTHTYAYRMNEHRVEARVEYVYAGAQAP